MNLERVLLRRREEQLAGPIDLLVDEHDLDVVCGSRRCANGAKCVDAVGGRPHRLHATNQGPECSACRKAKAPRRCLAGDCERPVRSNGYCKCHAERVRYFGMVETYVILSQKERDRMGASLRAGSVE